MWICTRSGFVSIKQHEVDNRVLVVRARNRKTLEDLFPDYGDYIREEGRDYQYRLFAVRGLVSNMLMRQLNLVDYSNFKDAVSSQGKNSENLRYLRFLHATWLNGLSLRDENARRFQATSPGKKEPANDSTGANQKEGRVSGKDRKFSGYWNRRSGLRLK